MKLLLLVLVSAFSLAAQQDGPPVSVSDGPPPSAVQKIYGYTSGNLTSICYGLSAVGGPRGALVTAISSATNANPVVFTSTAHGFSTSSRPQITITGGTGNWTAVNGIFVATVIDANTFSIAVNSTSLGAVAGSLVYTTYAPRTTLAEWAVARYVYDGSNNLIWSGWLNGVRSYNSKCSDATSTTVTQQ